MKKTYQMPVTEELFMETSEILADSYTSKGVDQNPDNAVFADDALTRMVSSGEFSLSLWDMIK
jgi:hypothetical protein